jgi:hypothetical protein
VKPQSAGRDSSFCDGCRVCQPYRFQRRRPAHQQQPYAEAPDNLCQQCRFLPPRRGGIRAMAVRAGVWPDWGLVRQCHGAWDTLADEPAVPPGVESGPEHSG